MLSFRNPTTDDSFGANWDPYTLDNEAYFDLGTELSSVCLTFYVSSPYSKCIQKRSSFKMFFL